MYIWVTGDSNNNKLLSFVSRFSHLRCTWRTFRLRSATEDSLTETMYFYVGRRWFMVSLKKNDLLLTVLEIGNFNQVVCIYCKQ